MRGRLLPERKARTAGGESWRKGRKETNALKTHSALFIPRKSGETSGAEKTKKGRRKEKPEVKRGNEKRQKEIRNAQNN